MRGARSSWGERSGWTGRGVARCRPVRVAILGPGGVGGFLAGALARAGEEVVLVARAQTASAIAADGLQVHSAVLGDFRARPATVVERLTAAVDVLVVATKAVGLGAAVARIAVEPPLVVPLLNGLDHMELLRLRWGAAAVAAGSIRIEATRTAAGVIVQSSPGVRVELAGGPGSAVEAFAGALVGAGVPARVLDSQAQVLWSKLVRLNALALCTSAFDRPLGEIRSDEAGRAALSGAVVETAAVAVADGAHVTAAETMEELAQAHPSLRSSMQRDIEAGREPELDAIAGSVLRAAARHGVPCPTVAALAERVAARAGIPAPVV